MARLVIGTPTRLNSGLIVVGTFIVPPDALPAVTVLPLSMTKLVCLDGTINFISPDIKLEADTSIRGRCVAIGRVLAEGRRRVHVNPVWTSEEEIGCQGFLQDDMFLSDRFIDELIKGD